MDVAGAIQILDGAIAGIDAHDGAYRTDLDAPSGGATGYFEIARNVERDAVLPLLELRSSPTRKQAPAPRASNVHSRSSPPTALPSKRS